MTTPEALVKYYDCLRESFSKIQDKDDSSLINAALRPKINEEFVKSKEVLNSYLNYIQVFSLIYSEHFLSICTNIIVPLFNDYEVILPRPELDSLENKPDLIDDERSIKLHEAIQNIVKSRPELSEEFSHTVVKIFPKLDEPTFNTYLRNCFKTCTYIHDEPLMTLVTKILDRLKSSCIIAAKEDGDHDAEKVLITLKEAYKTTYDNISALDGEQLKNLVEAILSSFTNNFISAEVVDDLNYLILYICSIKQEFSDLFIRLLWKTFTDSSRPLLERQASVKYISSFMSRAIFVELDKVFEFLELASDWCEDFLESESAQSPKQEGKISENVELFFTLVHSMIYLVSQRYRDMYEPESILKLEELDLERIFSCPLKPLETCDNELVGLFGEVANMYNIAFSLPEMSLVRPTKRRKSDSVEMKTSRGWKVPFKDTCKTLPERIVPLYRNYFHPKNFTMYQEF